MFIFNPSISNCTLLFQGRVDDIYKDLNDDRLDVVGIDLNPIEEMLQEAESAAQILGAQKQLRSIATSRRQFEELKAMVRKNAMNIDLKVKSCLLGLPGNQNLTNTQ